MKLTLLHHVGLHFLTGYVSSKLFTFGPCSVPGYYFGNSNAEMPTTLKEPTTTRNFFLSHFLSYFNQTLPFWPTARLVKRERQLITCFFLVYSQFNSIQFNPAQSSSIQLSSALLAPIRSYPIRCVRAIENEDVVNKCVQIGLITISIALPFFSFPLPLPPISA